MSDEEGRTFVSRWSRRKIAARRAEAVGAAEAKLVTSEEAIAPAPEASPAAEDPQPAEQPLPDVETLQGLRSEYRAFLRPGVDESLRRTALKKLFADPHFNLMDGLDVYIDDYSKPDPIPPAWLRSLNQARGLRLFEEDEERDPHTERRDVASHQRSATPPDEPADVAPDEQPVEPSDCPTETTCAMPALDQGGDVQNTG